MPAGVNDPDASPALVAGPAAPRHQCSCRSTIGRLALDIGRRCRLHTAVSAPAHVGLIAAGAGMLPLFAGQTHVVDSRLPCRHDAPSPPPRPARSRRGPDLPPGDRPLRRPGSEDSLAAGWRSPPRGAVVFLTRHARLPVRVVAADLGPAAGLPRDVQGKRRTHLLTNRTITSTHRQCRTFDGRCRDRSCDRAGPVAPVATGSRRWSHWRDDRSADRGRSPA
jgi:hypothetical protein